MPYIDLTYFSWGLNIAQLSQPSVQNRVNAYIQQYEAEFMVKLFGLEFYNLFVAELATARMQSLLIGVTYTYSGNTYRWNGLQYVIGSGNTAVKQSPIANYVYWHYLQDTAEVTIGIGTGVTTGENVTRTSPIRLQVKAWNDMIDMIISLRDYITRNPTQYPEYKSSQVEWFCHQNEFNL